MYCLHAWVHGGHAGVGRMHVGVGKMDRWAGTVGGNGRWANGWVAGMASGHHGRSRESRQTASGQPVEWRVSRWEGIQEGQRE